jgi:hypothetical protein
MDRTFGRLALAVLLLAAVLTAPATPARAAPPCRGIAVGPGANVQALFDANPPGTTFCFRRGTYVVAQPLVPKNSVSLVGAAGAVLSGTDVTAAAVVGYPARTTGVTVRGFTIERFTGNGTGGYDAAVVTYNGWTVANNDVRLNGNAGIRVTGTSVRVTGNAVHHNGRYGVVGAGSDILVDANEIASNNTRNFPVWDAGGTKFVSSTRLTFRGNNVHDNNGVGLWTDFNNIDVVFESNLVVNNRESGIQHEIGYRALIRNNTVSGNAASTVGRSLWWGANIFVHSSPDVEITGNDVTAANGANAIGLRDSIRSQVGSYGPFEVRNAWVHDNTVRMSTGSQTGLVSDRPEAFTSFGNRFDANTYLVTNLGDRDWEWQGARTKEEWRALGHDPLGRFLQW